MKLKKFVPSCETFPKGYGLAYRDAFRDGGICYPIPLNHLMKYIHAWFGKLEVPSPFRYEYVENTAYRLGVKDGYDFARTKLDIPLTTD
jgi:hypothetical protein